MPIFEYICRDCQRHFETIVTASRAAACPSCHGQQLEKQHSVFAVSAKGSTSSQNTGACGACGDPRGAGSCRVN
jgi:putative FmdB family regulatory protein